MRLDGGLADLDLLINNAAAYVDWAELASAADLAASEVVLATNLFGPWRMIQAFLPLLRQSSHPRIVNVLAVPAPTTMSSSG